MRWGFEDTGEVTLSLCIPCSPRQDSGGAGRRGAWLSAYSCAKHTEVYSCHENNAQTTLRLFYLTKIR